MKEKAFVMRKERMELTDKLGEKEYSLARLKKMQTELEAVLEEKHNQIDKLTEKTEELIVTNLLVANLTSLLKQKEAEAEEMRRRLAQKPLMSDDDDDKIAKNDKQASTEKEAGVLEYKEKITQDNEIDRKTATDEKLQLNNGEQERADDTGGLPQQGKWVKFQTNFDEADQKAENISSMNDESKLTHSQGSRQTEGEEIQMQENGQLNGEESNEQQEAPHRRKNRSRRKMVPSELMRQNQDDKIVVEIVKSGSRVDAKGTGTSSGENQTRLSENILVQDEKVDEKHHKWEENQWETSTESSKSAGQSNSSTDLLMLEINNNAVGQSSQENGDDSTEITQKEATSSTVQQNHEDTEKDNKIAEEKANNLEDKKKSLS
ncbi:hypothetical protein AXF42_Ash011491 [Apostasia shenzhenica]|uniref:Uncharacterized protein n=1 Tax=Apostasia shenzhenica TaxID=1088818 RepID=A0A2I0BAV1_9ASPA|nr:hypothetical protein AXF42_Ash011491 [Apostasia shenzhenica]